MCDKAGLCGFARSEKKVALPLDLKLRLSEDPRLNVVFMAADLRHKQMWECQQQLRTDWSPVRGKQDQGESEAPGQRK